MSGNPLLARCYSASLGVVTERYSYDEANRLAAVTNQTLDATGAPLESVVLDRRLYDGAGRLTQSGPGYLDSDYVAALTGQALSASGIVTRTNQYDANGRIVQTSVSKSDGSRSYELVNTNIDAAGNTLDYYVRDEQNATQWYSRSFAKLEDYQEASLSGVRSDNGGRPSHSTSTHDANGHLTSVVEDVWSNGTEAGSPQGSRTRSFVNDLNGMALTKTEEGHVLRQLVVNGQALTSYGVGTDPDKQLDADGNPNYVAQGEFGNTYQAITGHNAAGASSYTVHAGDTLQSIAQMSWGDASLWYRIADANGLAPGAALQAGQVLSLPSQTGGLHNTSQTFKPYDASRITGDTTPNMPTPPADDDGCGILGQIIMIVVAVVVAIYVPAALGLVAEAGASTLGVVVGGAIGAAAGSVASQVVGIAIGAQEEFSWKGVALAALSAGTMPGVGDLLGTTAGTLANAMVRAAVGNALSQGIAVVTGLQDHFDWKGVVASAVGAGVGNMVGSSLQKSGAFSGLGEFGGKVARGALTGLASGTAAALAHGARVDMQQIAGNAIGQALGDSLGNSLVQRMQQQRRSEALHGLPGQGSDEWEIAAKKVRQSVPKPIESTSPLDFLSSRPTNPNSALAKEIIGHDGPLTSVEDLRKYDKYLELQNRINNSLDESLNNLQTRRNELTNWDKLRDDTPKMLFYNAFGTTDAQARAQVLQRIDGVIEVNKSLSIDNFRLGDPELPQFKENPSEYAKVAAYVSQYDSSHTVYIGPAFDSGMSLPQTLTHELSHFNGTGPQVPYAKPELSGTVDNRIDPATGQNSGESYGVHQAHTLPPEVALYHADTFGFYVTDFMPAKREVPYSEYIKLQTKGGNRSGRVSLQEAALNQVAMQSTGGNNAVWDDAVLPSMADRYAQTYGGEASLMAGKMGSGGSDREANMARMLRMANDPSAMSSAMDVGLGGARDWMASDGVYHVEISLGLDSSTPGTGESPLPGMFPDATIIGRNGSGGEIWSGGGNTFPVSTPVVEVRSLPAPDAEVGLWRNSAKEYYEQAKDDAVRNGEAGTYLLAAGMGKLADIGYGIKDAAVAAWNKPDQAFIGVKKSIPNLGPESFNGSANMLKTSLDGLSLIGEQSGLFADGSLQGFRDTRAYNIDTLFKYR